MMTGQGIQYISRRVFLDRRCYEATGRKDQASLYYQRALALDKDFTEAAEGIRRLR